MAYSFFDAFSHVSGYLPNFRWRANRLALALAKGDDQRRQRTGFRGIGQKNCNELLF
ncbi:MAG: hypothetical protein J4F39_12980 [Candidatus Latescibacteria bacterium]|nr:hypothetical protein [Candidatus Latescibacterota bacterium]